MKIYFAGSIRGGREKQKIYSQIIEYLKMKGHVVLTEHVGYSNVIEKESQLTPGKIYERDLSFLKNCDLLIAEVSTPSLGVGYEIAKGECFKKPILCLCEENINLSALILGNPNIKLYFYKSIQEIFEILNDYLEK